MWIISKVKISTEFNAIRCYNALKIYLEKNSLRIVQKLVKGSLFNSMQRHTHDKKKLF